MNILYVVAIIGELIGISEKLWTSTLLLKGINYFIILSGYYFSMQSSVYLFMDQGRYSSIRRLKGIVTAEHLKGKELAQ